MIYYSSAQITLFNGDCLELMDNVGKVDKIITSPPYNINRRGYDLYKDRMTNEQYIDWILRIFQKYDEILNKNGAIMFNMSYGTKNTVAMSLVIAEIIRNTNFTLADIIVWKKQTATPNNMSSNKMTRIVEFVYIFCRRDEFFTFTSNKKALGERDDGQLIYENVFNFFEAKNNDITQDLNKATFSKDFVQELIDRYVRKDEVVLDNFCGTGTTLIACAENGIKSVGIELSKAQCEFTVARIKKGIQTRLF